MVNVSIIVPVYKVEPFLNDCINSLVNQTYKNLEIILIDDGSPDNCPKICDEWAKKDSRIKVVHKENGGQSTARNLGIDIAQGEYIGFVDSDDYIEETMYETLFDCLKKNNKKMSCCLTYFLYEDGSVVSASGADNSTIDLDINEALAYTFEKRVGNAVWCKLFEKSLWQNLRFPVGESVEDYPIMIPTLCDAGGMVLVNKPLYYYRKRQGSLTSRGSVSPKNAHYVYKNLNIMEKQLEEYNTASKKSFDFFVARTSFSMALVMEKDYKLLDDTIKASLKNYRKLMRKKIFVFMLSKYSSLKDKLLYILVLTHALRILYKITGKKL